MKILKTYRISKLRQMGCTVLCIFYVLGLFNGLVMETLHGVSHIMGPKTHQHYFAFGHEAIDYAALEGMAGHSHEALEALKELLEANQPDEQESKGELSLKLDKHLVKDANCPLGTNIPIVRNNNWKNQSVNTIWHLGVSTPPPQNS
ncbi:hypothetical protein [Maribacter polysaccharolyticus]|uniref:hypothetical protein n=1 Tax=Maribacter polysaccharolyticus TaxID=3020831 RepID=UPI00237FC842|nr:hypothetical protein [Maribacter polysaccharolyticus]MDE3742632.1 hypothetical protein [Maribacter polysaccharolyticus]